MNTKYDALIKAAQKKHLPGVDWRLLKAQLTQESGLNPRAVSPAGAQGIAQFMPNTWPEIRNELGYEKTSTAFDENLAIPAAAYYMSKLAHSWTAERPEADRYCLALASYNAGFGNLLKAQKYANGAVEYYPIIEQLHRVTGHKNSQETTEYIQKIFKIFGEYLTKGR